VNGTSTSARSATRTCGFGTPGAGHLLIRCNRAGRAVARYRFVLPRKAVGAPSFHVFATKSCCTGSHVSYELEKVGRQTYVATVRVRHRTRLTVKSLSLSYYVRA